MTGKRRDTAGVGALVCACALALVAHGGVARLVWSLSGGGDKAAFGTDRLLALAAAHATLAGLAILPAALLGVAGGVLVTRPSGQGLRPAIDTLVAALQAVPPVVVVALAFPVLGFGAAPTVLALLAYCIMPVLRGTVGALEAVPPDARESALAMGFTPRQILWHVDLPLAAPVILDSLRVALVLAVATAAVGALAGAATLGTPIIIGLQNQNELYVLQGAAATAALAFGTEGLLVLAASLAGMRAPSRGQAAARPAHWRG